MVDASAFFHDVLAGLERLESRWQGPVWFEDGLLNVGTSHPVLRRIRIFRRHWRFAGRVRGATPDTVCFAREFSNIPLALSLNARGGAGGKTVAMMHHNLQWAVTSPREARALRALIDQGVALVFPECVPERAMRALGLSTERSMAVPLPVQRCAATPPVKGGGFTVGLIGSWGADRGHDEVLNVLLSTPVVSNVLIGVPNPEHVPPRHDSRVEIRNTASPGAFHESIASCDAVVLNYRRSRYEYRASGLVSDAAARGVPVLVPAYPVMRRQITEPVRVGECFPDLESLPQQLERVRNVQMSGGYDFETYRRARTPERCVDLLVRRLEELHV